MRVDPGDVFLDLDPRVEPGDEVGGRDHLARADILRPEDDLPLQVRERNVVVVDDADRADAGGRQIGNQRRSKASRPDHQHAGALELRLPGTADLRQHQMAGIALDLGVVQRHGGKLGRSVRVSNRV
jgi:hypothetical protein